MPTAVYDASLLTKRKRALALYNFYTSNNAAVAVGASVRREQPDTQLQTIVTYRHETSANSTPAGGCACSQPVSFNPGGNNGKQVNF